MPSAALRRTPAEVIRQLWTRQFGLFIAASGTAAVLHWTSRIILNFFMPYAAALVVAYAIGITIAYLLNMRFVFIHATRPVSEQVRYFVLVNLIAFPFVWGTAYALAEVVFPHFGFTFHPRSVAHAIAICIPVVVNFLAHKYITFREIPTYASSAE